LPELLDSLPHQDIFHNGTRQTAKNPGKPKFSLQSLQISPSTSWLRRMLIAPDWVLPLPITAMPVIARHPLNPDWLRECYIL
jgi:hypothetical protein